MRKFGYPVNNWQDINSYPNLSKLKDELLAWEFLRRNPDYQNDFGVYSKTNDKKDKKAIREKWQLQGTLVDPKISIPKRLRYRFTLFPKPFSLNSPKELIEEYISNPFSSNLEEGMIFHLGLPIEIQLEKAKRHLLSLKKLSKTKAVKRTSNRILDKLVLYLRLLDAKGEKAREPQIIDELYKKGKSSSYLDDKDYFRERINNDIKAALKFSSNYFSLISTSPKKPT